MTTNNHPAHGPVSLERLHQIREILSKASAQSNGGNLGHAMADAVKVIDGALERRKADATPEFHTEASRFLPECLKAEEISGERRNSRIAELIGWFDRYYNGKANPKWFKSHTAELCYYILTAPPAPVVPDEKPIPEASKMHAIDAVAAIAEVRGWNACRAAMLQAGNSPVIPDGYVLVPIVPTEDMIINGFESVPDPHFSDEKEWEEYEALSGCRQAARRAELCWAAMMKAAPKQENI